jgi:hypothetical protein
MKKLTWAAAVALVAGALFVWTTSASAQTVTSDPIQTVPGETGCGGNSTIRDVTADFSCANQRTFHFGAITRTVVARSTFHADGTASTTFTLTGGLAPVDLKLRIVSHTGTSSSNGPVIDEVTGTIPKGTAGPVTLSYRFQCGQVDIKAILVGNGDSAGRISGPYLCTAPVETTTTVPASVAPTTTVAGATTSAPAVVPSTALTATAVGALPATGSGLAALFAAVVALLAGVTLITATRRRSAS